MINIEIKDIDSILSNEKGAMIIISILYEKGIITSKTYDNIMKKYTNNT